MLYCDVDGVVRNLTKAALEFSGYTPFIPKDWIWEVDGKSIFDLVTPKVLIEAETTEYYPLIYSYTFIYRIHFLSSQQESWRQYTDIWLNKYFNKCKYQTTYFESPFEKLKFFTEVLKVNPDSLLIEDYPGIPGKLSKNIILVDYLYNKHTQVEMRVKTPEELEIILQNYSLK